MPTTSADGMPLEEGNREKRPSLWRRARHHLACLLLAALLFLVLNAGLRLAFGSYGTLAGVAWDDYRQVETLDTVIVGNSTSQRAIDPKALDEVAGSSSVNLSTSGGMLADTYDAIRTAVEGRGVRRVIFGVGTATLTSPDNVAAYSVYAEARHEGDPVGRLVAQLGICRRFLRQQVSMASLSTWAFAQVANNQAMVANVRARLGGEDRRNLAHELNPGWTYVGKGYGNFSYLSDPASQDTTVGLYGPVVVSEDAWETFEDICAYCQERGVELVVVSTPHTAADLVAYGEAYPQTMERARQIAEGHGAIYLDGNYLKPQVLTLTYREFADFEHLNIYGADAFSRVLAQELARMEAGEDVSADFYASYDEWAQAQEGE